MTTTSRANSKSMYSWWWDSHISPKNSKWLQENLTDMDAKVKQMIKLLEEDADSFARRAEMYYKKRPELMKLVEEFYRAYRALAERYDHATGALRQAQRTMAEAFPNQVPFMPFDDSPVADPRTPEMPPPIRALFEPDELQKDALGLSPQLLNVGNRNGAFTEESNSVTSRRGLKQQFNEIFGSSDAINQPKFGEGRARKGLNFQDLGENEQNAKNIGSNGLKISNTDAEIITLKEALAKLEAEKEAGLLQYQQSLDRLSTLETEVSRAQEDSTRLNERALKAEAETQNLKEALIKLESEREASLLQYQQCLDKASHLENSILKIQKGAEELAERASRSENEAENLKQSLVEVEVEKETALVQYEVCLEMIADLEGKLLLAEESSKRYNELVDKAESELIIFKQTITKLTQENEAAALQYQQCMEKISSLENRISCAEEEAERLHREIDDGISMLKSAEEKCVLLDRSNLTLQSELEALVMKMGSQSQELTENQKELQRLWTCIQDEHMHFVEAETAFQTLQHLHSETEEELRSLAAELQNRTQILKNLEIQNQGLVIEVQEIKKENRNLDELNMSSALSIKDLQVQVSSLKEKIGKLEEEVELRTNERNALQQEIYCLKEEINDLKKKNGAILAQVESVGYNPECFGSSVKELQDENSRMREICLTERSEREALVEKLNILEKLVEKNAFLENSISDMSVDLEETRERVKMLEESCQSLLRDKSNLSSEKISLTSQLQITTENLENLSEKNVLLEHSLSDAIAELDESREKLMKLEDSHLLLEKQQFSLIVERDSLLFQLDTSQKTLEDLENRYKESAEGHVALAKERESAFFEIEKLKASLEVEKQAHSSFTEFNEKRLASMELQMRLLQEECDRWMEEYEEAMDRSVSSQFVIFVLQSCMQDIKENNVSLHLECQKHFEVSELSKEVISSLEHENTKRQEQVKSLVERNEILRTGLLQILRTLDFNTYHGCDDEIGQDQAVLDHIIVKIQGTQNSLHENSDEYQKLAIEKFVIVKFLEQLKIEAANILMERNTLDQELRNQSELKTMLENRMDKLMELNEEMSLQVMEGNRKEQLLMTEKENVCKNLHNMEEAYNVLSVENCKSLHEKKCLIEKISDLGRQKHQLEEENSNMFMETIFQKQLSFICKGIITENIEELRKLTQCMDKLQFINNDLEERVKVMDGKLGDERQWNLELIKSLKKSQSDAESYSMERNALDRELKNQYEQNSMLLGKVEKLQELNEEMGLKVMESDHKEAVLMSEMKNVCKNMYYLEGAYEILHAENRKAREEKVSFTKEISVLLKEKHELEEENNDIFTEVLFQSQLSFIYKDIVSEKCEALRKLADYMHRLQLAKSDLEERVKVTEEKLDGEQIKNIELIISLEKSQMEAEKYVMERNTLDQELKNQSEHNSILDSKIEKLLELNEELRFKVMEGNHKEESLMRELENACNKLNIVEGSYQTLHTENCKAIEEKISLTEEILGLRKEKHELEEVNNNMFSETISQNQLSFIYKDIVSENLEKLRKLITYMDKLHSINNDLEERVKVMEGKLGYEQTKKVELMRSLEKLNCEIHEVEKTLNFAENEKSELHKKVEQMTKKCGELEVINEEQNKLIDKISSDKVCLAKETEFLLQENSKMEMELKKLHGEAEKSMVREESLTSKLQMKKNEVQSWETQAATYFEELQISAVYELFFEGKIRELTGACENLRDENNSKDMEIKLLKDRFVGSERENGTMKSHLDEYALAIQSLKDSIASLEKHTIICAKTQKVGAEELEDSDVASYQYPESCQQPYENQVHHVGSVQLRNLHRRILAIEVAFEEFERQTTQEKLNANTKLEKLIKEFEEVKSVNGGYGGGRHITKGTAALPGHRYFNGSHSKSEIYEAGNEVMTKDILLDQTSDNTSHEISRKETARAGDRMLELWESTDQDGNISRMGSRSSKLSNSFTKYHQVEGLTKKRNSKHPSNESLVEKELGVDTLEISKRFSELHHEGNKRKILERLDSDAQKLANLQIIVQDLKKKMEVTGKSKIENGADYDVVKEQLEETDESITKLFEMNHKLKENVQDGYLPADGASKHDPEENDGAQSKRVSEQARRGSEKIGRLQLELKKLQFLIMKLDDERENRGKSKVSDRSPRVLLRDYLYGGIRTRTKHKKATFCACMRPPTKGD